MRGARAAKSWRACLTSHANRPLPSWLPESANARPIRALYRQGNPRGARRALIVIDASVLADFLLGRTEALAAVERETRERQHEPLHAPELVEPEILDALRKLVRGGVLSESRATQAVANEPYVPR